MNVTSNPSCCAISGACWCTPTLYGEKFSSTMPACIADRGSLPAPVMPDLPSTTTLRRIDRILQRPERQQRRRRIAAGIRDQVALGRRRARATRTTSGRARPAEGAEPYHRSYTGARQSGALPRDRPRRRGRRLDRRRRLVRQADEREVRLARERCLVGDENRDAPAAVAVQARVERRCRPGRRANWSRSRPARARGERARGRASPARCSRTRRRC